MLNISRITLGYQSQAVLEFDGLELPKGGQCLITGASGSGKTTLLYAIAGLVRVMAGRIVVGNTDITTLSEAALDHFRGQQIGMIFQTLHLMRSLTVLDNLLLASYVSDLPQQPERAQALLTELGIADKADALPETLSQGQAQRVAIARAVLHRPALILADEPTSSLDDDACAGVIGLIRRVARETGATLVISTHDCRVKEHFSHIIPLGGQS
jgi:putative ABC transport system ATP-binding protein